MASPTERAQSTLGPRNKPPAAPSDSGRSMGNKVAKAQATQVDRPSKLADMSAAKIRAR